MSICFHKPVEFQALPQSQPCAVQLDIKVGRCQAQFLTDFFAGEFPPLSHQKEPPLHCTQFVGTGFQDCKKLKALELLLGVAPIGRQLDKVTVGVKGNEFQWVGVTVLTVIDRAGFAAVMSRGVNHLALEVPTSQVLSCDRLSNDWGLTSAARIVSDTASSAQASLRNCKRANFNR
jgi:hypothetical protein